MAFQARLPLRPLRLLARTSIKPTSSSTGHRANQNLRASLFSTSSWNRSPPAPPSSEERRRAAASKRPSYLDEISALDELSGEIERIGGGSGGDGEGGEVNGSVGARGGSGSTWSAVGAAAVHTPGSLNPNVGVNASGRTFRRNSLNVEGKSFVNGQYYNPTTLSYESMVGERSRISRPLLGPTKKEAIQQDLIHFHGLKPGKPSLHDDSYKNGSILSAFVTEMGKIMPRAQTGLTRKSQRNIGKAVRRARAMGIIPVMSRGSNRRWK
ncbi:hypothetical protein IE53DRAFT_386166 [Violaceomyces palustris]|uniref:Uncharacterized protein n=1 Tax=Violaceomyces palustris TaxID=1673888 RepID=A0ACD0P0B3_9BASI|nr:hypothetical protein IE53DRAFT_386166 [Violaceomyces palustris]